MRVIDLEPIGREELLASLRRTPLIGFDGARPYEHAQLSIEPRRAPDSLAPAQSYVLAPNVRKVLELRAALAEHDIELFALDGGWWVRTDEHPEQPIPVIPPVVEQSIEPDGRTVMLVCDGLHRVFAARSLALSIAVVAVRGTPAEHPYYAYALPDGFADVVELEELPDGFQKKRYRVEGNYKALFRDFNAVLPGVQEQRKRSNPAHLRA